MRPRERQSRIADLVRSEGRVSVEELARRFGVSAETVRRDLVVLSDDGVVHKVHGGAVPPRSTGEDPFRQRMGHNVPAKRHIAKNARALVRPGDTLFIDTGTTTLMFAEELAGIEALTVITNSVEVASVLSAHEPPAELYLLGGVYNSDNRQTVGALALAQVDLFRAARAVLTIGTLDAAAGAMDYNIEEALVARAMIGRAQSALLLCDSSKFNRISPFAVAPLSAFEALVCESTPEGDLGRALGEAGVQVVC